MTIQGRQKHMELRRFDVLSTHGWPLLGISLPSSHDQTTNFYRALSLAVCTVEPLLRILQIKDTIG